VPLMNGEDVPACGFALYVDPIMKLVKPEILAKPQSQGILIRTEPEAMKESFSTASYLREAGYVVEFHAGGQGLTDLGWILDIRKKAPLFILTNLVKHRKVKAQTASEILALLTSEES
jgi:histidyl-tRNA synthetase